MGSILSDIGKGRRALKLLALPSFKRLAILLLVAVPLLAWLFVKPVRMIAPEAMGLSCPSASVCVDDVTQFPLAQALYAAALSDVSTDVVPIAHPSRVIFCSSQACADSFGLGKRSAVTLGTWGTIVSPHAWKLYYVRHELIHHLQAERIGVVRLLFKPQWFVEGMAYSLSQDPRVTLAEPWESDRRQFKSWYGSIDARQLWIEAEKL